MDQVVENIHSGNLNNENKAVNVKESPPRKGESETAIVYETVVLDDCPHNQVMRNHIDTISKIIDCKEHLQTNIEDFKFGNISSWDLSNQKFKHQIQIILKVKTVQLWKSPRGYLWRHLGSSNWTLHDGTAVSLVSIHQK